MKIAIRMIESGTFYLLPLAFVAALTGCADTRWSMFGPAHPPEHAYETGDKPAGDPDAKPKAHIIPASWFSKSEPKKPESPDQLPDTLPPSTADAKAKSSDQSWLKPGSWFAKKKPAAAPADSVVL